MSVTENDPPQREYYEHDANCSQKDFNPPNAFGFKQCKHCAGIFDKNGKGVCVTDKRFDRFRDV